MAAPIVAGAAALLMAARPGATYSEIRWGVACSCDGGRAFAFGGLPMCYCFHRRRWGRRCAAAAAAAAARLADARLRQPSPMLLLLPLARPSRCRNALLDVDLVPALSGKVASGGRLNVARAMASLLRGYSPPQPPPPVRPPLPPAAPSPPPPPPSCALPLASFDCHAFLPAVRSTQGLSGLLLSGACGPERQAVSAANCHSASVRLLACLTRCPCLRCPPRSLSVQITLCMSPAPSSS